MMMKEVLCLMLISSFMDVKQEPKKYFALLREKIYRRCS